MAIISVVNLLEYFSDINESIWCGLCQNILNLNYLVILLIVFARFSFIFRAPLHHGVLGPSFKPSMF